MNHHSLKWRLLPILALLHLVLFGLLAWSATRDMANMATDQARLRTSSLGVELSAALTAPMLERDYATLNDIASALVASSDIDYLVIFNAASTEMARAGLPKGTPPPDEDQGAESVGNVLDVRIALPQGHARVGVRMTQTTELLQRYALKSALTTLSAATLMGLVVVLATLWLTRRLAALEAAALALGQGALGTRVPPDGRDDEISHLGLAFNHMADQIHASVNELAESQSRVSAILQSIGDGLIATDTAMRVTYINPIAEALTGWSGAEALGRSIVEIMVIRNAVTGEPAEIPVTRVLQCGHIVGLANHTVLVARDGSRRHIADSAAPIRNGAGELVGVVMVFHDVTESYGLRASLEDSRSRLALALKGADLGLWDRNITTGEMVFDERWAAMLGYRLDEIEPNVATWRNAVHPDDLPAVMQAMHQHMQGLIPQYEAEHRLRTKTGEWRWVLTRGRVTARDAAGQPLRITGTHLDITERKRSESEIERLAYSDVLTGLPNRRLLLDRLQQAVVSAQRSGEFGAMLFINVDRFKQVNEAHGHAVGDQLLRHVASRLKAHVRAVDTVARIGGDEFIVLLLGLAEQVEPAANKARGLTEKLLQALSKDFFIGQAEHPVTASIGIAMFPEGDESGDELLRRADTAMHSAKASDRGNLRFFEPTMQATVTERVALERDLRLALEREELRLFLQPQFDAQGQVVSAEALVRWQHPERGLMSPASFIALAEETGLIVPVGDWVLQQSMQVLKQLEDAGRPMHISVNVSPLQFHEADFVGRIRTLLQQTGAYAPRLRLEITEGLLMNDINEGVTRMNELENLGVSFSIDDFGTGYSSLSYLKRMPLRELKIDRAFVNGLPRDPDDAALVDTILGIAKRLHLTTVAEGVETQAQWDALKTSGCEVFQGYLMGRPMPVASFLTQLGL